jgi:NADH-quinone oxidoreductase subunit K
VSVGVNHFVLLSGVLFAVGGFGVVARRNLLGVLMSAQVMLLAGALALGAFAHYGYRGAHPLSGGAFAFFVVLTGLAEVAVGTALLLLLHRRRDTLQADDLDDLRG